MYSDKRNFRGLVSDVFDDHVTTDYFLVFGAPPKELSAEDQATEFESILIHYTATSQPVLRQDLGICGRFTATRRNCGTTN